MDRRMSLGASAAPTCAIPSASLSTFLPIAPRREARDLQPQWRQWQAFRASAVAVGGQARLSSRPSERWGALALRGRTGRITEMGEAGAVAGHGGAVGRSWCQAG